LTPRPFGLPTGPKKGITSLHPGGDNCFAISKTGDVWAWGLNNYGMTGIPDKAGTDNATITNPRVVDALKGKEIVDIAGGRHHSIACTKSGECLAWGRVDSHQLGIDKAKLEKLPENDIMRSEIGKLRVVLVPQMVDIDGDVVMVAAANDHSFAVTKDGEAYSWGFNENYQTGHGDEDDDIAEATLLDNSAVRGKKLIGAGCGGQFSVLLGV
jgi:regulator of chromosome condensation